MDEQEQEQEQEQDARAWVLGCTDTDSISGAG